VSNRDLNFSPEDMKRLRGACRSLGTSFQEFVVFAVRQALDECEGLAKEARAISDYYEGRSAVVAGEELAVRLASGFAEGHGERL
jgi:hypothetical protein